MSRLILSFIVVTFVSACNTNRYTYVQVIKITNSKADRTVIDKAPVDLNVETDSAAYLEALRLYCISANASIDHVNEHVPGAIDTVPIKFKVLKGKEDITDKIRFEDMDKRKSEILLEVFNRK